MVRSSLILVILTVSVLRIDAWAQDSGVSAGLAPPLEPKAETPECMTPLCGFVVPQDLWKRGAMSEFSNETLNEDAVVLDRSRRGELDQRFAETPPLEVSFGKTSCFAGPTESSAWNGAGNVSYLRLSHCRY